jgi:DUF4097 and DUF4098 domain-containing protein YvlB
MRPVPLLGLSSLLPASLLLALGLPALAGCGSSRSGSGVMSVGSIQLSASAQREDEIPLAVAGGDRLRLSTSWGNVELREAPAGTPPILRASFTTHGRTDEEARAVLDRFSIAHTTSEGVQRYAVAGEPLTIRDGASSVSVAPQVHLVALVPTGLHVELESKSGSILCQAGCASANLESSYGQVTASGVRGDLRARTRSGSVAITDVLGKVEARTDYGRVEVERVQGDSCEIFSSSGALELASIDAARIGAKTSYGSVEARDLRGVFEAESSSGSISVARLDGASARLRSGYGNLSVEEAKANLSLSTASGSIQARAVQGVVNAESSYGRIEIDGELAGLSAKSASGAIQVRAANGSRMAEEWELRSGYGRVGIALPAGCAFELDAETKYGAVSCDFPILVEAGHKPKSGRLQGKVGSGGPRLLLRSASGSIEVQEAR